MTTVQHMKDALEAEQARALDLADHAVKLADQSFDAIGEITAQSTLWLQIVSGAVTILALLIALFAFFGYSFIQNAARGAAEKVANDHWNSYIDQDFHDKLSEVVHNEVAEQLTLEKFDELLDNVKGGRKSRKFPPKGDAK